MQHVKQSTYTEIESHPLLLDVQRPNEQRKDTKRAVGDYRHRQSTRPYLPRGI